MGSDGRSKRAVELRETRKARILEVAVGVFAEKGYHQTRVADIIAAANIARGTFYLYFESKAAIFVELVDELLLELQGMLVGVDVSPSAAPMEEQLLATVTGIVRRVRDHRELTRIIFREAVGLDADVDRRLQAFYRSLHQWIDDSLRTGQEIGWVRPLDTGVVASCILGSTKYLLEQSVLAGGSEGRDPEQVSREVLDYNLYGVLKTGTH